MKMTDDRHHETCVCRECRTATSFPVVDRRRVVAIDWEDVDVLRELTRGMESRFDDQTGRTEYFRSTRIGVHN
jgi:hypothetical protein